MSARAFNLRQIWRSRKRSDAEELERWQAIAKKVRLFASYRYLRGNGIEIGALNRPLRVFHDAKVRYIDRLPSEKLREAYPELAGESFVEVDAVDQGETLATVGDASCDFVIANHIIEHTQNPISAIENMLRVLKPNSVLYLALPDKRFTFDRDRPVTPYEHLKRDYFESPSWSEEFHYTEWIRCVGKVEDAVELKRRAAAIQAKGDNIHFHVWTQREMIDLILSLRRDFNFPIEIETMTKNSQEMVIVLRKIDLG